MLASLWVWFSSLSFVPVPWPDDSAFYFVARELFHWPPRWVMLPQAPFEPTYRIWNFNTMPLYPFIIGLGRFLGIDGSWALKFWPLGFWAASGVALAAALLRAGLSRWLVFFVIFAFSMDPTLRWASVLIRPESLIGFFGMLLVLGLCLGKFEKEPTRPWHDPVAALLALGAYAHFNAVHLVLPVVAAFAFRPQRIIKIGLNTAFFLMPWLVTVFWHFHLFQYQMGVQWERLAVGNDWLQSWEHASHGIFQGMGNPSPWPSELFLDAYGLWLLIIAALAALPYLLYLDYARRAQKPTTVRLAPAAAWVLAAAWLWEAKPEVWFTYYLHEALWCFAGVFLLVLHKNTRADSRVALGTVSFVAAASGLLFFIVNFDQARGLAASPSWHWDTYHEFVDCIDRQLVAAEAAKGPSAEPFQVWDPTFPDITIELSRRHPTWELTRTNDFYSRANLAIAHGKAVDAVVTTETLGTVERDLDAPMSEHPEIHSLWMEWKDYFLNRLQTDPTWKPKRYFCQKGLWEAFIYLK